MRDGLACTELRKGAQQMDFGTPVASSKVAAGVKAASRGFATR
jgi:hypothetical protein